MPRTTSVFWVGPSAVFTVRNPLPFFAIKQRIETALSVHAGRFVVVSLPNIANAFYGRDVGYNVERIVLDEATEAISATRKRRLSTAP